MSFNKPLVSILIPVHNCERYLNRSLDSLMNQSFQDYEVIVEVVSHKQARDIFIEREEPFKVEIIDS